MSSPPPPLGSCTVFQPSVRRHVGGPLAGALQDMLQEKQVASGGGPSIGTLRRAFKLPAVRRDRHGHGLNDNLVDGDIGRASLSLDVRQVATRIFTTPRLVALHHSRL